ncbi:MerR family transcriptional regulator [Actinocorallia libanotica]|uniref:HTH merR-type domain-containing protein n=1 Tax=Actinocorallia libanotica TaxID=46162 RepID=A0ABN1RQY4_9ACTN
MDTWTISELAERAAAALADLAVSGRVQDVPNERLIRWYATLGLLDPPIRQGRTARYTDRHLLQLVAVKRRQAAGRTLAEIQAELTGAPSEALLAITGPLPGLRAPSAPAAAARRRFWAAAPGDASAASVPPETSTSGGRPEGPAAVRAGTSPGAARTDDTTDAGEAEGTVHAGGAAAETTGTGVPDVQWATEVKVSGRAEASRVRSVAMQGIRLAPGVTLLLETATLDEEDLAALRAAAEPLLEALAERRLPAGAAAVGREDEHHL